MENSSKLQREITVITGLISILYGAIIALFVWRMFHPVISIVCLSVLYTQLILCLKVKKRFIKFIPMILLLLAGIVLIYMSTVTSGYGALVYVATAGLATFMILSCGVIWGICLIVKYIKNKGNK